MDEKFNVWPGCGPVSGLKKGILDMHDFKVGDTIRVDSASGSYGVLIQQTHYSNDHFYVRYYYGKDIKGEDVTALTTVNVDRIKHVPPEEFTAHRNREFNSGAKTL